MVRLELTWDRANHLFHRPENSHILRVRVWPLQELQSKAALPKHLAIAVDASGSMNSYRRWLQAIEIGMQALGSLSTGDLVSIALVNEQVWPILQCASGGPGAINAFMDAMERSHPNGQANLELAVQWMADTLDEEGYAARAILISDSGSFAAQGPREARSLICITKEIPGRFLPILVGPEDGTKSGLRFISGPVQEITSRLQSEFSAAPRVVDSGLDLNISVFEKHRVVGACRISPDYKLLDPQDLTHARIGPLYGQWPVDFLLEIHPGMGSRSKPEALVDVAEVTLASEGQVVCAERAQLQYTGSYLRLDDLDREVDDARLEWHLLRSRPALRSNHPDITLYNLSDLLNTPQEEAQQ